MFSPKKLFGIESDAFVFTSFSVYCPSGFFPLPLFRLRKARRFWGACLFLERLPLGLRKFLLLAVLLFPKLIFGSQLSRFFYSLLCLFFFRKRGPLVFLVTAPKRTPLLTLF